MSQVLLKQTEENLILLLGRSLLFMRLLKMKTISSVLVWIEFHDNFSGNR